MTGGSLNVGFTPTFVFLCSPNISGSNNIFFAVYNNGQKTAINITYNDAHNGMSILSGSVSVSGTTVKYTRGDNRNDLSVYILAAT